MQAYSLSTSTWHTKWEFLSSGQLKSNLLSHASIILSNHPPINLLLPNIIYQTKTKIKINNVKVKRNIYIKFKNKYTNVCISFLVWGSIQFYLKNSIYVCILLNNLFSHSPQKKILFSHKQFIHKIKTSLDYTYFNIGVVCYSSRPLWHCIRCANGPSLWRNLKLNFGG